VLAGVALTGAFHEDGLADTADGFGGGDDREAKLAIMRDSRHGSFAILALVFSIGLRATALAAIGDPLHAALGLVAAHAASRGVLPMTMFALAPARTDGLGFTAGRPSRAVAIIAAVIGAAIALAAFGPGRGAMALLLAGIAIALMAMLARRQIGGYTGDVLGAFQQIGEIVMLLAAAVR
jgi:adenosylcobinamide-GDP ribazoletransferase